MAGIPTFDPTYLSSPTMFGSVSPTTSKLLADAGKQLADKIEENSVKFEAQKEAPAIANLMGQGLTMLSAGDHTGFNYLAEAKARGASNPFLAKMTADALNEGNRAFTSHISEANATHRFDTSVSLEAAREDRAREDALADSDRQLLNQHERELAKYSQDEASRKRLAELQGGTYNPNPPPTPPKPRSKTFGGPGAASASPKKLGATPTPDGGLMGQTDLPQMDDKFVPGQGAVAQTAPVTTNPVAEAAAPPVARNVLIDDAFKNKADPTLVNENLKAAGEAPMKPEEKARFEQKFDTIPFGEMKFHIATPKEKGDVTETVKTDTGSVTFKSGDKKNDPGALVTEFKGLVSSVSNLDSDFSKWASAQFMQGKKVTVEPDPNDTKGKSAWMAKSDGVPMSKENPAAATDPAAPKMVTRPISSKVGEAWNRAQEILPQISKYVQRSFPPSQAEIEKAHKDQISLINEGKATLEEVNAINKSKNMPLIDKAQVTKEAQPSVDPEVEKQLEQRGIKNPNKKEEPADETPKGVEDQIKELQKQVDKLVKEVKANPTKYADLASAQEELNYLTRNRKKLARGEQEDRELFQPSSY